MFFFFLGGGGLEGGGRGFVTFECCLTKCILSDYVQILFLGPMNDISFLKRILMEADDGYFKTISSEKS